MLANDPAGEIVAVLSRLLPEEKGPYSLHEPELTEVERARVCEALDEGYVSYAGRHVGLFEKALAETCGTAEAIAIVNGTVALHAVQYALGIGPGDEVLCPALTFVATANAIVHAGAVPHFIDSDPDDLGIDVERLDAYLKAVAANDGGRLVNRETGRRIAAVMPVHIFGHIGDMAGLRRVAGEWGLPVIEDATEALGSADASGPAGRAGIAAVLSFNGNKIVTTGGGGAVLTDDYDLANRLRHLTTTAKCPHAWRFEHDEVGYNYRLPNINAALGLAQLERLEDFVERKRKLAAAYIEAFSASRNWRPLVEPNDCRSNYWLNAVMLPEPDHALLETVLTALHAAGYFCRPCWTPMHRLAIHAGHPRANLPAAEEIAGRLICLPSSPRLAEHLTT